MARFGGMLATNLTDTVGVMNGDVMTKKRVGAIVGGRRVIGRTSVNIRHLLDATSNEHLTPRWVKLKGGLMGNTHVGDLLVCVELMQCGQAYLCEPKSSVPDTKLCTLSLSMK